MQKKAEIGMVDGKLDDLDYVGYQVTLTDVEGVETYERFVFSETHLGNSLLVVELDHNEDDGFQVKKLRKTYTRDQRGLNLANGLSYIIAKTRAIEFAGRENIKDFVIEAIAQTS